MGAWKDWSDFGEFSRAEVAENALLVLQGRAQFEGPTHAVFLRVAGHNLLSGVTTPSNGKQYGRRTMDNVWEGLLACCRNADLPLELKVMVRFDACYLCDVVADACHARSGPA